MKYTRDCLRFTVIVAVTAACAVFALAAASPAPTTRPDVVQPRQSLGLWMRAAVARQYDAIEQGEPVGQAAGEVNRLFDQAIAYAPSADPEAIREAACAERMVWLLEGVGDARDRAGLLRFLRANDAFAHTLLFLMRPDQEGSAKLVKVVQRLRYERPDKVEAYSQLAAAICVVHSHSVKQRINENEATAADPVAIFDYFSANEPRMLCGIKTVSAELLVYVVDTTASVDEMTWALNRYAGNRKVGQAFFDIKYDYAFARAGANKELTKRGFTLPNIYTYGGICADQAYFATMVAKSIGVPSCYTLGRSAEAGHAWVGFLEFDDRHCWWDFDTGRYAAYWNLRGVVRDPITGQMVPDSYVSLTAELIGTKPRDRQIAIALSDAVWYAVALDGKNARIVAPVPHGSVTDALPTPRSDPFAAAMELLEIAVKLAPADRNCWMPLAVLAHRGKLSPEQKQSWAQMLFGLCGGNYPDFAFTVLAPMIESIADPVEKDRMWSAAANAFHARDDLVAACLMEQAAIWEDQKQPDRAGALYWQVVQRSAQSSPYILKALEKCEEVLIRTGRGKEIVAMYAQAWEQTRKPTPGPPASQSNWYLVGQKLKEQLEAAGDKQKAAELKTMLDAALHPSSNVEIMR